MPETINAASTAEQGRSSDLLLRLIADSVPALMAYFDLPGLHCLFANQGYAAYNGHSTESILGLTVQEAIGDKAWQAIQPHVERSSRGEHVKYAREQTLPNGELRMIEVNLIPHFDAAQKDRQLGSFVLITDITERWRAERSVRESEERMRKFTEATDEAIVFHRDGLISDGNEALYRLTGYALHEVVGLSIFNFISPEWRAVALDYTRSGREDPYEVTIRHKDGHAIPVEVVGKTMPFHHADYRIVVVRDITARKQAQEREAFNALHDSLTQLPNRRHLMDQLAKALVRHRQDRVAVLFVNLDHFKTVNDSLGHHAGDQLLREVADRLRHCVGDADVVARLGSDEFVLVLTHIQAPEDAARVADAVLQAMRTVFTVGHLPLTMSPSIGISLFPDDGATGDALLRCADAAMQQAKDSGRGNRQFYQPGMDLRAMEVLQQERLLREAIADSAFVLHYQPQICLKDGTLRGFEALVRWRHPVRGLVGPIEFIAFAESRGLITPIGRWVLHEACRQLKAWQDEGLALVPVAVNLSALEFRQRDVAGEIATALQATGLAPQYLEIELTESVLMHQTGQVLGTLQALKDLGVGISIDDFGTGYSSLAYLKRYPIDKLKIDRSFVMDTPGSADDVAIVTAIVQMGRSLQLKTVAEGVETAEQMALLRRLDCDLVQGHLVSEPMDAPAIRQWLLGHSARTAA